MSNKPDRPITSIVFPKSGPPFFKQFKLPDSKDELERAVIQRFVKVSQHNGEQLEYAGSAPEPADAFVVDRNGINIYLQLCEVVDVQRIRVTQARARYGFEVWTNIELQELYRGVQVAMLDFGQMLDVPKPTSRTGRALVDELRQELRSLKTIIESLPMNAEGEFKGKETCVMLSTTPMKLSIRLLRYASPKDESPGKWFWTGSVPVDSNGFLLRFQEVMKRKCNHYGRIADPYWLLLYSLDCYCGEFEQAHLADFLVGEDHPFDRVTVFMPFELGGNLKELFPRPKDLPPSSDLPRKKLLVHLIPEDMNPKWDDPRWNVIGFQADESVFENSP